LLFSTYFKEREIKDQSSAKLANRSSGVISFYIIQRLIVKIGGNRFITDLEALIFEYEDDIDFLHIGFPSNWRELLSNIHNQKS
jgi:abortive infection bacteriophage resistance protein